MAPRPAEYFGKYRQKISRQSHVMQKGGGIWGRRCCGRIGGGVDGRLSNSRAGQNRPKQQPFATVTGRCQVNTIKV